MTEKKAAGYAGAAPVCVLYSYLSTVVFSLAQEKVTAIAAHKKAAAIKITVFLVICFMFI